MHFVGSITFHTVKTIYKKPQDDPTLSWAGGPRGLSLGKKQVPGLQGQKEKNGRRSTRGEQL